ncbi:MAG TPA: hypothetical protein VM933_09055 [Acidimicrobiales bacterium]|nr:hypothetical protein [Acidimicrobiales bacterium]
MPPDVRPAELARLLDTSERPRAEGWSLRAALTRYAQPQPQRASAVIELVRRLEAALRPHTKRFEKDGEAVWAAVTAPAATTEGPAGDPAVDLLRALQPLDALADVLAAWAVDRATPRPDDAVDAVVGSLIARLEELGVPREERPTPPPGARRRG